MFAARTICCYLAATLLMAQNALQDGIALDRAGKYQEANKKLTEAARIRATPQVLNNLAVNLVHLERIPQAIATFEQVLSKDPNNASALFNVGSLYVATAQWDLAIARLHTLDQATPGDAGVHSKLAQAHRGLAEQFLRTGKLQESVTAFQSALDFEPEDASTYVGLALALLRGNAPSDAIALLEGASRKFPTDLRIAIAQGYAYEDAGKWTDASQCYRKALELDPESAVAMAALGRVLQHTGDAAQSLQILRTAVSRHPQNAAVFYELGNLLLLNDPKSPEGVALMERVAALSPGRAEPKYLLAKSAIARDDLTAAKRWALAAVQADNLFAAPHYLLAAIYRKLNDAASAERELGLFRKMENNRRQRENADLELTIYAKPGKNVPGNAGEFVIP